MIARLTPAQARALGIDATGGGDNPKPKRKRTRRTEPVNGQYRSICHDCAEVFTSYAAETRHVDEKHHARFSTIPEPGEATQ